MKKRILLLSIAVIVIVTFVSCEGDIFQSISDFMGQTGSNVLLDGGAVTVPTENIEELEDALGETTPDVEKVRDSVKKILESESETGAAKELLDEEVEDEEIPADVEGAMEDLEDDLGFVRGTLRIETKGDLAKAILLKDLKTKKDALGEDSSEEEKAALVEDAKVVIEFIKKVSPIGQIDVTTALVDLLGELMGEDRSSRGGTSRVPDPEMNFQEIFDIAKPIFNMYFDAIDANGNGIIDVGASGSLGELERAVQDYSILRSSYESAATSIEEGEVVSNLVEGDMKLTDLIAYVSSVIITENENLIPQIVQDGSDPLSTYPATDFRTILSLIKAYIVSGSSDSPDWWFIEDLILIEWKDSFETFVGDVNNETILHTILAISQAIPDNTYITGQIQNFVGGDD